MEAKKFNIPQAIAKLGIESLNPMQKACLDMFNEHKNIKLLSPTGSGKTLAFALPIVSNVRPDLNKIQVLVLAPSRELALQVESVFKSLQSNLKISCFYGGHSFQVEKRSLELEPHILIGTPGRIADHIERETFDAQDVKFLILDEFDKSLELGFQNEMSFIIHSLRNLENKFLSSATAELNFPSFIKADEFRELNYLNPENQSPDLSLFSVKSSVKDKLYTLVDLLQDFGSELTLVFCNHRESVERTADYLTRHNIICSYFHGGMEQKDRERTLIKFKNGSSRILVTTDLASRGLDISEIKNIVHYHLPTSESAFVHRNGRTARMHAKGRAFIILHLEEQIPEYVEDTVAEYHISSKRNEFENPKWETLFIGKGKKDKVNKGDIMGFLINEGKLQNSEIGLIEVKDYFAYAAVSRSKIQGLLHLISGKKIKNKKAKFEIAK